jgi:hypothetical protein
MASSTTGICWCWASSIQIDIRFGKQKTGRRILLQRFFVESIWSTWLTSPFDSFGSNKHSRQASDCERFALSPTQFLICILLFLLRSQVPRKLIAIVTNCQNCPASISLLRSYNRRLRHFVRDSGSRLPASIWNSWRFYFLRQCLLSSINTELILQESEKNYGHRYF